KSVESDVTHVALGGKIEEGNVRVDLRAVFAPDSGFSKAGKDVKALEGGPLAGLPSGPFVFALGGVVPEKAMKAVSTFSLDLMKGIFKDMPADKLKKIDQIYTDMLKGFRGMGLVYQVGKEDDAFFKNLVGVSHVGNASAYLKAFEKANEATTDLF